MRLVVALGVVSMLLACSDDSAGPDGSTPDSSHADGAVMDTGTSDSALTDSTTADTSSGDSAATDTASSDTGSGQTPCTGTALASCMNVNASCTEEYEATGAAGGQSTCEAGGGTWSSAPCSRTNAVGGCFVLNIPGISCTINWFYSPTYTRDIVEQACSTDVIDP